jgi:hypothetical protein
MSQTRIYVPLALADLDDLARRRALGKAPLAAYTVTDALAAALPTADEEEREYVALSDAAEAAGALRERPGDRRVLAAADVDAVVVTDDSDPGHTTGRLEGDLSRVRVAEPVPLPRVVSFHVDEVGGEEDEEMLWYDVTELDELRRFVRT